MADYSGFGKLIDNVWSEATSELNAYYSEPNCNYNPHKWGANVSDFDIVKYFNDNKEVKALCFSPCCGFSRNRRHIFFTPERTEMITGRDVLKGMLFANISSDGNHPTIQNILNSKALTVSLPHEEIDEDNEAFKTLVPSELWGDGNFDFGY